MPLRSSYLRFRYELVSRLLDGTPLILLTKHSWRSNTLSRMRLHDDDVMDMARQQGIKDLPGIRTAVLETFGEITIIPREQKD